METFIDHGSKERLLLDPESSMVYLMDKTEKWPLLHGLVEGGDIVVQGSAPLLQELIFR